METVKLGIIGFGNMGTDHARSILAGKVPDIELVAVADQKESRRAVAKELKPDLQLFSEGTDLIKSRACDAVLIATPHYEHPTLAALAFENNLHVLCEKPAGVYTLQVRDMMAAADKSDRVFAMMFNQRTNPLYKKMRELIQNGELGAIKRVNWIVTDWYRSQSYYNSGGWRATWAGEGGGVLLNQCPHNLDLLQWIAGMPSKVTAHCHEGLWHDIEVEDDVTAYLEYPNGATGVFITSTADAPGTNRLEITGEMGSLVSENGRLTFHKLEMNEREWCYTTEQGFRCGPYETLDITPEGEAPQHVGIMQAFAGAILRGEPLVADGREGINGLMLSNAMHLSSWLGKSVDMPIDEQLFLDLLNEKRASSKTKTAVQETTLDTSGSY